MCQCRGHRFNLWSRKIPHAPKGQLSPSTTTTEACVLRAHAPQQEKSLQWKVCSVQFSRSVMSNILRPHGPQHARLSCPSPTPRACSNSCPLIRWCHPTISSSVPFSSHLQSFLASGSFPVSQFFTSGGQSMGVQLQPQSFQWIFRTDFL